MQKLPIKTGRMLNEKPNEDHNKKQAAPPNLNETSKKAMPRLSTNQKKEAQKEPLK